ncbi:MAG: hypothetical protein MJ126_01015 [Lachnospiraceae bacterium]|nr:hypothetical protein [Lachnospiraceae bacterium]
MKKFTIAVTIIVVGIIALIFGSIFSHHRKLNYVLTSHDQMVISIADAVIDHKTTIKFDSAVSPDTLNFTELYLKVLERNENTACEFYSYSYRYTMSGGLYHVKVEMSRPYLITEKLAKIRAKSIAKALNKKLSNDYDKVKAIHDYLILINKYSYFYGGSFNCLYLRSSACNGYAYSFYLIMKEAGIPVQLDFSTDHVWNKVMVDGKWYYVDVTWDDLGGGNVGYDYFLKCDADWDHGGSGVDAKESLEVRGRGPKENKNLIPNYRGFAIAIGIVFVILCFPLFKLLKKFIDEQELKEINKQLEEEEMERIRFQKELDRKRQEFSNRDDDFFAL